jgi:hypothetical protein
LSFFVEGSWEEVIVENLFVGQARTLSKEAWDKLTKEGYDVTDVPLGTG